VTYGPQMSSGPTCQVCGGMPAAKAAFRSLITIVAFYQVSTHKGLYCHQCGTALCRKQTKTTLIGGWWGLPMFMIPVWLLMNLYNWTIVNGLPQAQYAFAPGTVGPTYGRPLPYGTPVWRSPALLVPVLLVVAFVGILVFAN
jgi:hypothetical protein